MTKYYVVGQHGFLDSEYNSIPENAKELSEERFNLLFEAQANGLEINFNTDPPTPKLPAPPPREHYIERAKEHRAKIEKGGVLVDGHWFHSDEPSQIKYLGLLNQAQAALAQGGTMNSTLPLNGTPFVWQTMDNGAVQLKISTVLAIPGAIANHSNACFAVCRDHVEQLQTIDQYWDYDYTANYPAVYSNQNQS